MSCSQWSAYVRLLSLVAFVAMLPATRVVASVPTEFRPIALSGQPAAGVPGATYSTIFSGNAVVNDHGQVVFQAQLSGSGVTSLNDFGLWLENSPTSHTLIARSGNQPPGLPDGVTFSGGFEPPGLNNRGEVTTIASIEPAVMPIEGGIFTTAGGPLRLLAADRYPLPNASGSPTVQRGVWFALINDAGQSSFSAPLSDSASYWVDTPGQPLRRVVTTGDTLPGDFSPHVLALNNSWLANNGRLAFRAYANTSFGNYYGLWSEVSGTTQLVARDGGTAPNVSGTISSIYNTTMSRNGMLAFDAFTSGGSRVLLAQRTDGTLRLVARTGITIPGSSVSLSNLFATSINSLGQTAFQGYISGSPSSPLPNSIWFEDKLGLHMAARAGQSAPGTGGVFDSFERIQFNDNGDLMFEGRLTEGVGGVTNANSSGIWLRQRNGFITLVARAGDYIDIAPGPATDLRRIIYADAVGDYGQVEQSRRTLTNNGEVLFHAYFDDGTSGLFLSQVIPEPPALAMALTIAIPAAAFRFARQ